jgi:branched-chain amino acid transport system ATP-binding protein
MRPTESTQLTFAILALTVGGVIFGALSEGYTPFVLALVALTTIVGVGMNVLLGLSGQVSLGHVGFYAIGAYTAAILIIQGVSFWIAFPIAGLVAGVVGAFLALPALRVAGPYFAMVTIAFAFIVQHGIIEWKSLTGGQNGLLGLQAPTLFGRSFAEREMAMLAVAVAGAAMLLYQRIAASAWGKAMLAVRDSEIAARSIGLNPVTVKAVAFTISAVFTGLAGAIFAPLLMFVAPDSFPFSQSILFLLAVIIGGSGWALGPLVGAAISVVLPELLASLAEYRLLFFGALLLAVLWLAPRGVIGTLAALLPRAQPRKAAAPKFDVVAWLRPTAPAALEVEGLRIAFGGLRAVNDVTFTANPRAITSLIGPNGAGKTTVVNMIGGFYRPDQGNIRLGDQELGGAPPWRVARARIARTYQTSKLFDAMSVLDNVLIALRRGRLGGLLAKAARQDDRACAEALLAFVGYQGDVNATSGDLPHVSRRLVEIARALACRPQVLLLDEPAAGLMRGEKKELEGLLRQIRECGIAILLIEHDMSLVMGISDHVVVLDAGTLIAAGPPMQVRNDPKVLRAYLGENGRHARPRAAAFTVIGKPVLHTVGLTAGYGAAPVLENMNVEIYPGEMVAMLGANGAGKSTALRAMAGLLPPSRGDVQLDGVKIAGLEAHRIVAKGLSLVPEGRQVFPELSVYDNLLLGGFSRHDDIDADLEALLRRFPRLRERLDRSAGLLSGGEQQMLAIARGLMAKPRVLLLDEPSLGLAPGMINELFDILAELRDQGTTILLVDQMAAMALTAADRGYVLESGRVVRAEMAAALASDPALEAAYLGQAKDGPSARQCHSSRS